MRLIPTKTISPLINRCYLDYDPDWPSSLPKQRVFAFRDHVTCTAGLRLEFIPKIQDVSGKFGYELTQAAVVDEKKYMLFLMKYSS